MHCYCGKYWGFPRKELCKLRYGENSRSHTFWDPRESRKRKLLLAGEGVKNCLSVESMASTKEEIMRDAPGLVGGANFLQESAETPGENVAQPTRVKSAEQALEEVSEPLSGSLARLAMERNEGQRNPEENEAETPSKFPENSTKELGTRNESDENITSLLPESYEEQHVHQVYEQIASHFSSTRYKPWPIVEAFLQSLRAGSIGLDIGCGNGKYLAVNKDIFIVGSDRSSNLIQIAKQHQPHSAVVADSLALPHQDGRFDFAICIAVVHHLSTPDRRREAVKCILRTLRPDGKALVYVWALEQGSSRRGWDEGHEQDVMVPWVLKSGKKKAAEGAEPEKTFQRYYHLYRKGELEEDIQTVGGKVVDGGYEKDNWWVVCRKGGDE